MSDDRLHAILIEPQLKRFRQRFRLDGVPLTASFTGFHRHAILAPDRVFLFPRHRAHVPGLRREAAILSSLAGRGVPAPRLLGLWDDRAISPYPFIAVSRLSGQLWADLESTATLGQVTTLMASVGRAIASWHRLDHRTLSRGRRRRGPIERFLTTTLVPAAQDAARRLDLPARSAAAWIDALEPLTTLSPVFVHGDVHEGQILVDDALRVTGILDWETAHVGHPLEDFEFGEWGYGIFVWERHFGLLRRHLWEAYAEARGCPLPPWQAVHLYACLSHAHWFGQRPTLDDWGRARLETLLECLRCWPDEVVAAAVVADGEASPGERH